MGLSKLVVLLSVPRAVAPSRPASKGTSRHHLPVCAQSSQGDMSTHVKITRA